jgi:hypothetical protein
VNQLYEALNVEEHQLNKERELCGQLEELKVELEPLEQVSKMFVRKHCFVVQLEETVIVISWL